MNNSNQRWFLVVLGVAFLWAVRRLFTEGGLVVDTKVLLFSLLLVAYYFLTRSQSTPPQPSEYPDLPPIHQFKTPQNLRLMPILAVVILVALIFFGLQFLFANYYAPVFQTFGDNAS